MPDFSYIAVDATGKRVSGSISAGSRREALAALSSRALFPVEVHGEGTAASAGRVRRVPPQQLATMYGQLADLLRSGVPLLRSLEVLREQSTHAGLKHVLGEVHRQVEDGATLAQAMGRYENIFGEMAISMVRAGGEGAFLEEALSRVAEFTEAQEDLKKRTLGAVIYPLVVATFGTLVVAALIVFFVPQFAQLFERLRDRGELPLITEWLLWLSDTLRWAGPPLLAVLVVFGWWIRRKLRTEAGRWWWDRTKLRMPLAGQIFWHLAVARFCRVLGTLLRNGVPILRSLEIASEATGNRVLAAAIREASESISAGQPLAEPLAQSGRFPPMVIEMIAVAEQANTLEQVLVNIADGLERRTWRKLDLAVRLLEPILLVLLAGAVLVVVLALLLPILKMSGMV
jgi:general secretion pathway protein F/type IV pilus assembly protein PilC